MTLQLRNSLEKIQTISEQVASRLSQDCQCSISADYVTNAQLSCDPAVSTDIIFRARLSSTSEVSNIDLIIILREWVRSGAAFIVAENAHLVVDANCEVELLSFNDPVCPVSVVTTEISATEVSTTFGDDVVGTSSESSSSLLWPIIGAIAGGILLILVVLIAIQIFNHCGRSKRY